jgi:putative multiple sugar transport system substrate-binding protein
MAFNARSVGNQAGEKILAAMGISQESTAPVVRPLKMEMLMGAPDSIQSLFFYNGLMEVLEPAIEKGVLSIPSGLMSFDETAVMDSDKKSAADRFEKIRTEFYKGGVPDILITADEDYAIEILKNLREEEKLPYITTAGRKLETIKKIASGLIGSAVFLDNRILAQKCAETVHTLLKGSEDPEISDYEMYDNGVKIVSTIFVDTEVIDQDNYEMLADNGYFTEAELRIQLSPTPEPGASGTPAPTITPTPAPSSGAADSDTPREKTAKADPTPTQKPED